MPEMLEIRWGAEAAKHRAAAPSIFMLCSTSNVGSFGLGPTTAVRPLPAETSTRE
jgi:hypothetical protein